MPFDANGNYSLPTIYLATPGTVIRSTQHNTPFEDVQAALNNCVLRDGRAPWSGNQNINGYRLTGMADGTAAQDAVTKAQLDTKQNNLGFTPVQQGGGDGQGGNKIYVGWNGATNKLKIQVDSVDQGNLALETWASNNLASEATSRANADADLQSQVNARVTTMADDSDAASGKINNLIYNKTLQQPVIFPAYLAGGPYAGLAIPISQTFGADGFVSISNVVYRASDGALQVNIGSINSANVIDYAPVSSVQTVQSNLASEATVRANADANLQSQVNARVASMAASDGVNSPITFLAWEEDNQTPWISVGGGAGITVIKTVPGAADGTFTYNKIRNITMRNDGALIVLDDTGSTRIYTHS